MDLVFADDSRQDSPSRDGMGPIMAIGGIQVTDSKVKIIEEELNSLCKERYGFPPKESFKWSPKKDMWMHKYLVEDDRERFFKEAISIAKNNEASINVIIADTRYKTITGNDDREIDLLNVFLERIHRKSLRHDTSSLVIVSQPGGGRGDEYKFLAKCSDSLECGTDYVKYERIVLNIISTSHKFIRLLQLADVITSCTTAYVCGEDQYSPTIFDMIKPMFDRDSTRIGGIGLKIHPDIYYANLYHWLLGDDTFRKGSMGVGMPLPNFPYASDPNRF